MKKLAIALALTASFVVSGCGPDDQSVSDSLSAMGWGKGGKPKNNKEQVEPAPAPTPTPSPTPSPTPTPTPVSGTYDFNGGTTYPAAATVNLTAFDVPAGSTTIHVPVELNQPTANTVIAFVRVYNGNGGRANPDMTKPVIFRPGDPLRQTVSFAVYGMSEGNTVNVMQSWVPDGAKRGTSSVLATARAGSINEPILNAARAPLPFEPLGTLTYSTTAQDLKFSDEGGPNTWITRLAHGRTQVGNAETGYYSEADSGVFEKTSEGLKLKSFRLATPVSVGSPATLYPFAASMLAGFKAPEMQFKYGTIEWEARMPNRKGSWPALWLLPKGGWPPEIDVFEGFYYNSDHRTGSQLSANIHGGDNNQRTFTRPMFRAKMSDFGLKNTLDTEFHKFAVRVEPEWITMWVDGVETMRYANAFVGETWYPLMNVAVKAGMDDPYNTGSGEMTVRSVKIWRAE